MNLNRFPIRIGISLLFYLLSILVSVGQEIRKIQFSKAKRLPTEKYAMANCTDNKQIFAIGGGDSHFPSNNTLYAYDTVLGKWLKLHQKTRFTPQRYASAIYQPESNSVIWLGGTTEIGNSINLVNQVFVYNLSKRRVFTSDENKLNTRNPGMDYWDGKLYCFGGTKAMSIDSNRKLVAEYSDELYSYDPINKIWEELPKLPTAKETEGVIIDGFLYLLGGFNGKALSEIHRYNLNNQEWQKLEDFPQPVSAYAITKWKQYIFLIGDYEKGDQLIVYDTHKLSYKLYSMNFSARHAGAVVLNDELHVFGGIFPSASPPVLDTHWVLDLTTVDWQLISNP